MLSTKFNSVSDIVNNTNADVTIIQYFLKSTIKCINIVVINFDVAVSFIIEMLIVDGPGRESYPGHLGIS